MKFIKVTSVSNYIEDSDDTSTATFYLNTDMIKLISSDGSIYLKTIAPDSELDTLFNGDIVFTKIKVHPDSLDEFLNNLQ